MKKGALMRLFSAAVVIVLAAAVVLTDIYTKGLTAEEEGINAEGWQENYPAVIETEKLTRVLQDKDTIAQGLPEEAEEEKEKETWTLTPLDGGKRLFTNKVDGYTIQIPGDMEADMSLSNIRAVLENETLKIEVYCQQTGRTAESGAESYINYSNRFIGNYIDHHKEAAGKTELGGRTASFLQWSRSALAGIKNDKCHYASVDVPLSKQETVTFLFKSSLEFADQSYLDVVKSLELVEKTAEPYVRKIRRTENTGWDAETAETFERYFGDDAGLSWGIFETAAPLDFTELKKIEERLDFTFPILLYYTGILENRDRHPNLAAALENAEQEGRILELTLQPEKQIPESGNMVYDILDGKYDAFLKNYAGEVAACGEPVLFRLANEMNGDWCVYSSWHTSKDTDIFKTFYRYVYHIFRDAGADNVIWVWNPNGRSFPDFKWNDELCYYPGDEYVDVVGMTGYNTGTYYTSEAWKEFDQIYDPLYAKYTGLYEKPLMITEFSSSSVGGSKEAWVAGMFRNIRKYDRIKAAVWWDGCDWDTDGNVARSYFIDETEELVRLFRENLAWFK